MCTFYVHDAACFSDTIVRKQVADQIFLFLPKIVSTLSRIALGDEKQSVAIFSVSDRNHLLFQCILQLNVVH